MKKTVISIIILLFVLTLHKTGITYSSVPPTGKTGAPGEETCYTSQCHLLGVLNPPNAGIDILFNNGTNSYQPDSVYQVSVTVTDSNQKIFGFELTALDSNELMIGDFIILDSSNTFISWAGSKQYISHFNAADPNNVGTGFFTWQFQWVAPSANSGSISFYAAGVAAENPISAPAGNVHTATLSVSQDTTVEVLENHSNEFNVSIFPNPANQYLIVSASGTQTKPMNIVLHNLAGQIIAVYTMERGKPLKLITAGIPDGVYFLSVDKQLNKKIIVAH